MSAPRITRKQFIAAAVCPSCDAVDRIVVEVAVLEEAGSGTSEVSRRRCVACGFADDFAPIGEAGFQGMPRGRPDRPRTAPVNPVKVRILDPKEPGL